MRKTAGTTTPLSLTDVQVLLDRRKGEGMIVSCYADTTQAGYLSAWEVRLAEEAQRAESRLDAEARDRLARDLDVIRRTLRDPAATRARGVAVFSAADAGFFQVFLLGVPVDDRLVLDEQPYLVPLLQALHRQRRYLVVLTDSHRGRLYAAGWGHARLLESVAGDVPRRVRSSGERWGKQQATIERHRRDHMLHYRKDLSSRIERAWADMPFDGVILFGEHETIAAVRAELPPAIADAVVHEAPHSWSGRQPSIEAKVSRVLEAALAEHDRRLVEEVERRLRESYRIAAGPQEVIDALRNGQVGYPGYLVLEPDRGEPATRCTNCGSLFADQRGVCPYCGSACERVNLWQELLLFAARHDIPAHAVAASEELDRHAGVAAVLSREGPWEATP
jgi:peptide subunit release factor 1 (eRF1)